MKCPICNSEKLTDLVYHQGVFQCQECRHLFRQDANTFDYNFYSQHDYWYNDPHWRRFMRTYFAFFDDFIMPHSPTIEFGAANGDFLSVVNEEVPISIIYYNELVDLVNPKYDCIIPKENRFIGSIEEISLPSMFVDNVFLIEVLEHCKSPYKVFSVLQKITRIGGRVCIATDNAEHLNAPDMIFRHREHLHIFSERSFRQLLTSYPFKILLYWNSPVGKSYIVLEKT